MGAGEKTRLVAWSRELRGVHDRLREALTVTQRALSDGEPAQPVTRDLLLLAGLKATVARSATPGPVDGMRWW